MTHVIRDIQRSFRQNELSDTPKKFAILTVARTGSNYLCNALNGHPEILCHGELFHQKQIYIYDRKNSDLDLGTIQERDRCPERFVERVWQHNLGHSAVGFKLFPKHNEKVLKLLLKDKKIKKILLLRRNKIRSYVSLQIACQTQEWDIRNSAMETPGKTQKSTSVKINPKSFQDYVQKNNYFFDKLRRTLNASNQEFLEITYEDLFGTESAILKSELLEFIDVSVNSKYLKADLKKQNPQPLSELVSNFHELESALRETELEPYLYLPDF
ncbi:MAG: hypothetical protein SVX43_09505 [Cyanobacteriota bacterium]|nr:hypothetical protein [Cyanobacteriota bacterium]